MKNLLYLAKYYSDLEDTFVITKNQFLEAVLESKINNLKFIIAIEKIEKDLELGFRNKKVIDYERIKDYLNEDPSSYIYEKELDELLEKLQENGLSLQTNTIKHTMSIEDDTLILSKKIKKNLEEKIIGQNLAINEIIDSIKNKFDDNKTGPLYSYFFLGPPATGKTYMGELLCENFKNYKFLELDMTQYSNHNDGISLFGTERGWGNASNGYLTSFVKDNPQTVILFDEFEKAHTNIQRRMLSLFSRGFLNDNLGWDKNGKPYKTDDEDLEGDPIEKVDFTKTIVIFTSNLGSELYNNSKYLNDEDSSDTEITILQTLQAETKKEANEDVPAIIPEMISRLSQGKIVLFNHLKFSHLFSIVEETFKNKVNLFKQKADIGIAYEKNQKELLSILLLKYAPYMDTRRIKAKVFEDFLDEFTDFLIDKDLTYDDVSNVIIELSKKTKEFMKNELQEKIDNDSIKKFMFRKNLTLDLDVKVSKENQNIKYKIENVSFKKVKKVSDFVEKGGLVFDVPDVSFQDIVGNDEVKIRLKEVINILKKPDLLKKFDAKTPKGMLLFGPPGTGKTMFAKAFANEANLPFIQTTANELLDLENMKDVFKRARTYSPSIIFIDEIDTFGIRNKSGDKRVINEFLTQVDGFSSNLEDTVFIIAATNNRHDIDPAILRPGRLELNIEVPSLDKKGREFFIKKILEKPCEKNIDIEKLIMYSYGMTGAQLEKVANESALYAIRHNKNLISEEILLEEIKNEKYGKRIVHKSLKELLEETAYHEAGHAVIAKKLLPSLKIQEITITPRANSLGMVSFNMEESLNINSKNEMLSQIKIAYAGRVAQIKKFGEEGIDAGASNDLMKATRLAFDMVSKYGMDDEIGYINLESFEQKDVLFKAEIEQKVSKLLQEMKTQTQELVNKYWLEIESVAKMLLEKEVIHEGELLESFSNLVTKVKK